MTDEEIIKRCAERMGLTRDILAVLESGFNGRAYDPLHNDDEAMALVKKFGLNLNHKYMGDSVMWNVWSGKHPLIDIDCKDLNRAICECVAQLPDKSER